ncbi:MAG: YkgJ family cysteine cluster protein [Acidobacteriaceae bacterium]
MPLPRRDRELVQTVDAAFADAARRSGEWLVCRPGCTQCCIGAFAINALDAQRLRHGMEILETLDPQRANRVRERAHNYLRRVGRDFPGNTETGILDQSEAGHAAFEEFANDEPCPALDLSTGLCEVYEFRPMTCRVFGPPLRSEGGIGHCELCYHGASEGQIAACELLPDPAGLESELLRQLPQAEMDEQTIVAFCLTS